MKKSFAILALGLGLAACQQGGMGGNATMKTQMDSVSYAVGLNMGKSLKSDSLTTINPDMIAAGIKAAFAGDSSVMKDSIVRTVMMNFQMEMMRKQQEKQAKVGETNQKDGEKFLAENKTKEGVSTTASGLEYQVITPGTGASPTDSDEVTVEYEGRLLDGTIFDSSKQHGQPATFQVNGVIPGWTEALKLMKEGGKMKVWVPSNLAYGPGGNPPKIGPNATLEFEIELLKVTKK